MNQYDIPPVYIQPLTAPSSLKSLTTGGSWFLKLRSAKWSTQNRRTQSPMPLRVLPAVMLGGGGEEHNASIEHAVTAVIRVVALVLSPLFGFPPSPPLTSVATSTSSAFDAAPPAPPAAPSPPPALLRCSRSIARAKRATISVNLFV